MGFIRGSVVFILTVLLFIALFLGNIFLTLNWSLDYNNVQPYLKNLTNNLAKDSGSKALLLQEYNSKRIICSEKISINLTFEGNQIQIPCDIINKDAKLTIDYVINETIPKIYYKSYKCKFLDCLKTENQPLVLISEKGKEYWGDKFYSVFLISLIIFALLFLFVKEKHSSFILAGTMIIFSAIPFKQIIWLLSLIPEVLPFKIMPIFFSESSRVFLVMLILGIFFIAFGIGFSFFKWGRRINNILSKIIGKIKKNGDEEPQEKLTKNDIEEMVKKEIEKSTKTKNKTKKRNTKN